MGSPSASGQSHVEPVVPQSPADELAALVRIEVPCLPADAGPEQRLQYRALQAQIWLDQAERLAAFRSRVDDTDVAAEARRQETLALFRAAQAGDETKKERRNEMLQAVRLDSSLSAAKRCHVVAVSLYFGLRPMVGANPDEWLAACAEVERKLIAEFPDAPNGYEALLRIAYSGSEEAAGILARELDDASGTPASVREAASRLLRRLALVGTPLPRELLDQSATDREPGSSSGGPIVIYAWASNSRASIGLAQQIGAMVTTETRVIGICLDSDADGARTVATAQKLPGMIVYGAGGSRPTVADTLLIDGLPLVVVADEAGVIQSVMAHRRFARVLPPTNLR